MIAKVRDIQHLQLFTINSDLLKNKSFFRMQPYLNWRALKTVRMSGIEDGRYLRQAPWAKSV